MTDDRAAVLASPAYLAMTPVGRRVLARIEDEVARSGGGAVEIPRTGFDMTLASATKGARQCEAVGFINITFGVRRTYTFTLADRWRTVTADEAARLVKQAKMARPVEARPVKPAPAPKPPKPAPTPKPVEQPRMVERRTPSLPRLSFMDDGR